MYSGSSWHGAVLWKHAAKGWGATAVAAGQEIWPMYSGSSGHGAGVCSQTSLHCCVRSYRLYIVVLQVNYSRLLNWHATGVVSKHQLHIHWELRQTPLTKFHWAVSNLPASLMNTSISRDAEDCPPHGPPWPGDQHALCPTPNGPTYHLEAGQFH